MQKDNCFNNDAVTFGYQYEKIGSEPLTLLCKKYLRVNLKPNCLCENNKISKRKHRRKHK